MIFENMDRIVFAGDSITDMGSKMPVGEWTELGKGYPAIVDSLLASGYPEQSLRITNSAISGDTSRDLLERFQRDVLSLQPQWISICIGINDVWRQFDCPARPDLWVLPEEYEANLRKMIAGSMAVAKGVFLVTPYFMEPNRQDPMRCRMQEYVEICYRLAEEYRCVLVDFQGMFDRFFQKKYSALLSWDRVHPNAIGSTLMARKWLSCCGFDYEHNDI